MIVPTMCIRVMRVFMRQSFVAMQVAVLDVGRHRPIMRVLVMRIVEMYMLMLAHLMRVRVAMPLGQVQPDAERHEAASGQQTQPDRFIEQRNRQCGTGRSARPKVRARSRHAEVARATTNKARLTP